MKIIVFGANGMAGHMISLYLQEQGHDITGFVKNKNNFVKCIEGNALDAELVKKILQKSDYDVVINCIGILNKAVDARLAEGIYINSVLPHFLEECVENMEMRVIHISSDCVFTGSRGRYREDSRPDADSYYGRTKELGEIFGKNSLTFRTSIVGPFMNQAGSVNGFTEVIWSGITTLELAKSINSVLNQNLTGLYHLVNNQVISKYELLCLFNKYMNNNRTIIHENGSFSNDKSLEDPRQELTYRILSYEDMVRELAEWMRKHEKVYRQYFK